MLYWFLFSPFFPCVAAFVVVTGLPRLPAPSWEWQFITESANHGRATQIKKQSSFSQHLFGSSSFLFWRSFLLFFFDTPRSPFPNVSPDVKKKKKQKETKTIWQFKKELRKWQKSRNYKKVLVPHIHIHIYTTPIPFVLRVSFN